MLTIMKRSLKSGPSPWTVAFTRSDALAAKPVGLLAVSLSVFTKARAVARRTRQRSCWKRRCIATACSTSRCVCSTNSFVFLGMLRGMSCSGGGPVPPLAPSSVDFRDRIFTPSVPLRPAVTRLCSSRPKRPKWSAVSESFVW